MPLGPTIVYMESRIKLELTGLMKHSFESPAKEVSSESGEFAARLLQVENLPGRELVSARPALPLASDGLTAQRRTVSTLAVSADRNSGIITEGEGLPVLHNLNRHQGVFSEG